MYNHILVGTDGSEDSIRAARKALEFHKKFGSKITIFHSVIHRMPPQKLPLFFPFSKSGNDNYSIPEPDYYEIQKRFKEAGNKVIEETLEIFKEAGVKVEAKLVIDVKPDVYAKRMSKKDVDLIIVGCEGHHSKLRTALIGTVAEKILNKAKCDVLISR